MAFMNFAVYVVKFINKMKKSGFYIANIFFIKNGKLSLIINIYNNSNNDNNG